VIVVRYADDSVMGVEKKAMAERFLEELRERLAKFGLSLHPEKTRLIEFGRYAAERRLARGEGRPETFDFLGFVLPSRAPDGEEANGSNTGRDPGDALPAAARRATSAIT
jgi:hypothetical protein